MQSYASCLLPSLLRCVAACSSCAGLFWFYSYFAVSACPLFWAFAAFLCSTYFAVHAGIACLAFLTYDSSQLHAGIVCLAFLAYDWAIACWDSLSVLLHAGIACLALLAYDWAIACWDSLSALSMLGKHV